MLQGTLASLLILSVVSARGGYCQLRQLRPLKRCVTDEAIKKLTHAFIGSRLDYCNVLHCSNGEGLLSRLQSVQNAAARLVTGLGQREHITPVLRQLHWLSVRQRVIFKLATLVHHSLAGTAPAYLSVECHLISSVGVRSLRSANSRTCVPQRAHNGYGVLCFATAGPSLRNSLPLQLREPYISFNRFKTILKMFLFLVTWDRVGSRGITGTAAIRRRLLLRFQTVKTVKIPAPNCSFLTPSPLISKRR